jgi:hypothetical protein
MWVGLGIVSGLLLAVLSLLRYSQRKPNKNIDVGSVSDAWLAEHRGRTSD